MLLLLLLFPNGPTYDYIMMKQTVWKKTRNTKKKKELENLREQVRPHGFARDRQSATQCCN